MADLSLWMKNTKRETGKNYNTQKVHLKDFHMATTYDYNLRLFTLSISTMSEKKRCQNFCWRSLASSSQSQVNVNVNVNKHVINTSHTLLKSHHLLLLDKLVIKKMHLDWVLYIWASWCYLAHDKEQSCWTGIAAMCVSFNRSLLYLPCPARLHLQGSGGDPSWLLLPAVTRCINHPLRLP